MELVLEEFWAGHQTDEQDLISGNQAPIRERFVLGQIVRLAVRGEEIVTSRTQGCVVEDDC